MRAILQRAKYGKVQVNQQIVGQISGGVVILLGINRTDTMTEMQKLAEKIAHLRIFSDDMGRMNRSALDVKAEILLVSQFTLYADCRKGRRPSYSQAAPSSIAEPLFEAMVAYLGGLGISKVATGQFGADMLVDIQNDGPVTIILDTAEL